MDTFLIYALIFNLFVPEKDIGWMATYVAP